VPNHDCPGIMEVLIQRKVRTASPTRI